MSTAAVPLPRTQALAYRAAVHDLEKPARDPARCAALGIGLQDTPAGTTARLALRARVTPAAAAGLAGVADSDELALVHSVRGTMHLHRIADLGLFAAAMRVEDAAKLAGYTHGPFFAELAERGIGPAVALDEAATAMRAVMGDGQRRTKGELSGAIVSAVDSRLAPWCPGCGVHHVHDGLFRLATLQAGLHLVSDGTPTRVRFAALPETPAGPPGGTPDAWRELLRRFLRTASPATPDELAAWLGLATGAAGELWAAAGDDLAEVDADGWRAWVHAADLDDVLSAPPPAAVRLLPPYDPITEAGRREFLVPDRARRREVWRATANPGIVLGTGEVVGTWRQRISGRQLRLTVRAFRDLTEPELGAVAEEAAGVARCRGLSRSEVRYD